MPGRVQTNNKDALRYYVRSIAPVTAELAQEITVNEDHEDVVTGDLDKVMSHILN